GGVGGVDHRRRALVGHQRDGRDPLDVHDTRRPQPSRRGGSVDGVTVGSGSCTGGTVDTADRTTGAVTGPPVATVASASTSCAGACGPATRAAASTATRPALTLVRRLVLRNHSV